MYKYGEKILVRNEEEKKWNERIFIHFDEFLNAVCVFYEYDINFKNNDGFPSFTWKYYKLLSQKYDPAEMVGRTVKNKKHKNHYLIIGEANTRGVWLGTDKDSCMPWEEFDEIFEIVK